MAKTKTDALPMPTFDKPVKLLFVLAPGPKEVTDLMEEAARDVAKGCGAEVEMIAVPGCAEVPTAIGISERMAEFDGYVALACVEDDGFAATEAMLREVGHAISLMGLQGLCIGNGILRSASLGEAKDLAGAKGAQAAAAALHLIALSRKWASMPKGIGFRP